MIKEKGVIKLKKYFSLEEIGKDVYFDNNTPELAYFRIPHQIEWDLFEEITKRIKVNVALGDFDTALGAFHIGGKTEYIIRVLKIQRSFQSIDLIRQDYLTYIKKAGIVKYQCCLGLFSEHFDGFFNLACGYPVNDLFHLLYFTGKFLSFSSTDPGQLQSLFFNAHLFQFFPEPLNSFQSLVIGIDVMTIIQVATGNENGSGSAPEGMQHEFLRYPAAAHAPDDPDRWWILHAADTCEISACIGTPVAAKGDYFLVCILLCNSINLCQQSADP